MKFIKNKITNLSVGQEKMNEDIWNISHQLE